MCQQVPHNFKQELHEIPAFKWKSYPLFLGNAAFLYLLSTAILPLEQGMYVLSLPDFFLSRIVISLPAGSLWWWCLEGRSSDDNVTAL